MTKHFKDKHKTISVEGRKNARKGRPTKYNEAFPEMMYDFFNIPLTTTKMVRDKNGNESEQEVANALPLICSFAIEIGVNESTMRAWTTLKDENDNLKYPDFSAVYKDCRGYQERMLVGNTMGGLYEKTFSIFAAKNIIQYRDKHEIDVKVNGSVGISVITDDTSNKDASNTYTDAMNGRG